MVNVHQAGLFYNKEDIQDIFYLIRKYQSAVKTKKDIINVQNDIIETAMEHK